MSAADQEPATSAEKEPAGVASGDRPRAAEEADGADEPNEKTPLKKAPPRPPVKEREGAWLTRLSDNAWILIPMLVPVAVIVGTIQGAGAAFLVLIATALVAVIALFWSSVRTLLGETPLSGADAYALAAPRAEEEQKQSVLRALKDLEFERSVGKISDDDYSVLVAKYRAEAKRLLRVLEDDARPKRQKVEGLVHARLVEAGLETAPATYRSTSDAEPAPEGKPRNKKKKAKADKAAAEPDARSVEIEPADAPEKGAGSASGGKVNVDSTWKSAATLKTKESPAYRPPTKRCGECRTRNDADAVFCKKCGSRVFEGSPVQVKKADPKDEAAPSSAEDELADTSAADPHDGPADTDSPAKETSR